MTMFIDPPSIFASVEEWEQFLAEMKRLRDQSPDVRNAIIEAEETIKRKRENGERS